MTITETAPAPDQPTEERPSRELVHRAQQGDTEAFAVIYDRYVGVIYRYVYSKVSTRQVAEDLTADTFYRALKKIHLYQDQNRGFINWLMTIAGRLVLDYYKAANTRLTFPAADMPSAIAVHGLDNGTVTSPEKAVTEYLDQIELLEAVMALNPTMRECLVLRYLLDFSLADTARATGRSEGAVKSIVYRAVRLIRRKLPHLAFA